jgi:EAL domain-containing protein (putative c-di-GMP-specific phosphodiesterase class I)
MTATSANDEVLAFAIVAMAFVLGMTTLTGGIEAPERLVTLRCLGCAFAQGYLLARALTAPDVRRLLLPAPRW